MAALRIRLSRPQGWAGDGMVCVVRPDTALHGEYIDAQSYDELVRAVVEHRTAINGAGTVRVIPGDEPVAEAKHAADQRLWAALPTSPAPTDALAGERDSVPSQSGTGGDQPVSVASGLLDDKPLTAAGVILAAQTSPAPVGENDIARKGGDAGDPAGEDAPSPSTAGADSDESAPADLSEYDRRCCCDRDKVLVECPFHGGGI
jgi:hypothetical protein